MGIFDRMGKVISSNVNSLLDKAEDDRKLIELNLDEMGEQLKAGRQEVIAAVAAEKQLRKKHEDLVAEAEKWDKRAELALKSGDEALAREALKQKKRVTGEADVVDKSRAAQRDQALKMKDELERMEQKLEELKMRKGTIVELGSGDVIASKVTANCQRGAISTSMKSRFATVKYERNWRNSTRTIPVPEDFALKVGDPVFIKWQDCNSPIEARRP